MKTYSSNEINELMAERNRKLIYADGDENAFSRKLFCEVSDVVARDAKMLKELEKIEAKPAAIYEELYFISRKQLNELKRLLLEGSK